MKKRVSATLIGAFVVGGLALLAVAIIGVAGNDLFKRKERAVMHFSGSIYGLQVGAPVVFRGVRIGNVTSIQVLYDKATDSFSIPVVAELERDAVSRMDGRRAQGDEAPPLPTLVQRGLRAQLSMQSLLTGLLYVDLDLRPETTAALRGGYEGAIEIPTAATAIQNLKHQLDGMDFRRLFEDVSVIAGSVRGLASGPQLKKAFDDLEQITGHLRQIAAKVDQRIGPLADNAQKTLVDASAAFDRIGGAADGVNATAKRFDTTAERASALLAPDSELVKKVQDAANELSRTATALRQAASGDSTLMRNAERTLQDVSRAARALRELADSLERRPESLIRGRPAPTPLKPTP